MKTTTTYRQTLTITTDDDGNRTITRTSSADTVTAYLFTELSPEAQARAIQDAITSEMSEPYGMTYFDEEEIWSCARDLEKQQPVYLGTDAGGSPYGSARRYRWSTPDWEAVTEAEDDGICWSMDMCDTWNAYAARIIALQEAHEEATARAWTHDTAADTASDNGAHEIEEAERRRATFYDDMAERIEDAAEELTEDAARAVGNIVDGLIESARDWYTSHEFWREWLTDSDDRYARDGARI